MYEVRVKGKLTRRNSKHLRKWMMKLLAYLPLLFPVSPSPLPAHYPSPVIDRGMDSEQQEGKDQQERVRIGRPIVSSWETDSDKESSARGDERQRVMKRENQEKRTMF